MTNSGDRGRPARHVAGRDRGLAAARRVRRAL